MRLGSTLSRSRILFPIRTAERVIELTEDGSGVMERNAVFGQLTILREPESTASAGDSYIQGCGNHCDGQAFRSLLGPRADRISVAAAHVAMLDDRRTRRVFSQRAFDTKSHSFARFAVPARLALRGAG